MKSLLFLFLLLAAGLASASVQIEQQTFVLEPRTHHTTTLVIVNDASMDKTYRTDLACLGCEPSGKHAYADESVVISSFGPSGFFAGQQKTGILELTVLPDADAKTHEYTLRVFADGVQEFQDTIAVEVVKETFWTRTISFFFNTSWLSALFLFAIVLLLSVVGLALFVRVEQKPVHTGVFWTVALLSAVVLTTALRYLLL